MTYHPLPFAPEDIELIRLGLARRAEGGFDTVAPPAAATALR
jgi:hypothetical protein